MTIHIDPCGCDESAELRKLIERIREHTANTLATFRLGGGSTVDALAATLGLVGDTLTRLEEDRARWVVSAAAELRSRETAKAMAWPRETER